MDIVFCGLPRAEDAEKEQEEELEHVEIPKVEAIGTSLGDLFKNIKL